MALFENSRYSTIKEAIFYSTGDNGVLSVYVNPKTNKEVYFVNGKPFLSFGKKK